MNKNYKVLLLFVVLAVVLLFGLNDLLSITDSVESNYALTAKEMVLSGDWMSPQIYGKYWYDKPIFFYWLTAFGFKIFGFNEFGARFFPALFGLGALGLTYWAGKKMYNERVGLYSAIILGSSIEFFLISKSIITDSVLFFFFNATLLFFYLGFKEKNKNYYYGTYAFAALATLTKGPIGFLLPGLIIVLFMLITKNWKILKSAKLISGTALFLIIALPWYLYMYSVHGMAFIDVFLGTHNFLRAVVSEHPRDNVFYYYFAVNLLAFFPWIGFVPKVLKELFSKEGRKNKLSSDKIYLLIWVVTIFVFFQLMQTKYITYTYPLLFPLSLLVGEYLERKIEEIKFAGVLVYNAVFYCLLIGLVVWFDLQKTINVSTVFLVVLLLMTALTSVFLEQLYFYNNKKRIVTVLAGFAMVFNYMLISGVAVDFSDLRSAKSVAQAIEGLKPYQNENVIYAYGRYPTSAVFYLGGEFDLLIKRENVEKFKPKAFSWSSKDVMPYYEIEKLAMKKEKSLVAMKKGSFKRFVQEKAGHWDLVFATKNGWEIFQKKS